MKTLILDFLRRWWWLFAVATLTSVGGSAGGVPFVFAPAAVIALLLDAQRGVFRAVRPLPIARVDQAKAWWFVGVPLLPLLSIPFLAVGVLISQAIHPPSERERFAQNLPSPEVAAARAEFEREAPLAVPAPPPVVQRPFFAPPPFQPGRAPAPWFAAGVQLWVAFGYAGLCFFVIQWLPTRAAESVVEHVQQGIAGGLWGFSMPAAIFLLPNLPRTPAAIVPWHWAVFAAAPVFVALSYFTAADIVQRRMFVTGVKPRPQADAQPGAIGGGLTGVPLFVLNFAGRIVLILVAIAGIQIVVMRWMLGANLPSNNPAIVMQVVMMGLLFGAMTTEAIGMRALRVLPLSTLRLAILLSLISWTAALTSAAFAALWCRMGDPALPLWMNFAGYALAMCGWATLALAALLHIASTARVFVLMIFVMIPSACLSFLHTHTALFAVVGAVSGTAGFALLVRGLKKSAAFYRPRGFFGMTPGQPSAVR